MLKWGTINRHEFGLLQFADSVDEAFTRIRSELEEYSMDPDDRFFMNKLRGISGVAIYGNTGTSPFSLSINRTSRIDS